MDVEIFWSKHIVVVKPFKTSLQQSSKTLVEWERKRNKERKREREKEREKERTIERVR